MHAKLMILCKIAGQNMQFCIGTFVLTKIKLFNNDSVLNRVPKLAEYQGVLK